MDRLSKGKMKITTRRQNTTLPEGKQFIIPLHTLVILAADF